MPQETCHTKTLLCQFWHLYRSGWKYNINMTKKIVVGMSLVSRRGQITIPSELRRKFNIKEGDTVFFLLEQTDGEEKIIITKGPIVLD